MRWSQLAWLLFFGSCSHPHSFPTVALFVPPIVVSRHRLLSGRGTCSPPSSSSSSSSSSWLLLYDAKAGTFFYPVPAEGNDNNDDEDNESRVVRNADPASMDTSDNNEITGTGTPTTMNTGVSFPDDDWEDLLRRRKAPLRASEPSTIGGIPTAKVRATATGWTSRIISSRSDSRNSSSSNSSSPPSSRTSQSKKTFVGIGPPLNDLRNPEIDDQGYTLYADETTGKKSRVFEALVEYPCNFTLKIVGANEGSFVPDIVALVAESCGVEVSTVPHSVRAMGKWISVTVQAPVQSAEMLYALYEMLDRDPRVKFKF